MSIRARLLLLTLLLTALPALWQVGRFVQERHRSIEADSARLQLIAQRRAELIADKIQGTTQLLYGLAHARDLDSPDRGACSAFLAKVLAANPQYTGLLTIKPDGSLFCDSLRSGRQLDRAPHVFAQRQEVQRVIACIDQRQRKQFPARTPHVGRVDGIRHRMCAERRR